MNVIKSCVQYLTDLLHICNRDHLIYPKMSKGRAIKGYRAHSESKDDEYNCDTDEPKVILE